MRSDAATYVQRCGTCQRVKGQHIKPSGLLQPLPSPEGRWNSVSMDFIVQLPPTKLGHDAIVVFVDRLTKMVHFAPPNRLWTRLRADNQIVQTPCIQITWPAQGHYLR